MVLIKSPSELYEIVDSLDWFHSIGKPLRDLHHLIPVTHIQDAITLWQSPTFLEARSVAWEAFRQEIVKNRSTLSQWEKEFTFFCFQFKQVFLYDTFFRVIRVFRGPNNYEILNSH